MDQPLDLLAEIQTTPEPAVRERLRKLTKPVLVNLVAGLVREWKRERSELRAEIEKRDFHARRVEELLARTARHD